MPKGQCLRIISIEAAVSLCCKRQPKLLGRINDAYLHNINNVIAICTRLHNHIRKKNEIREEEVETQFSDLYFV